MQIGLTGLALSIEQDAVPRLVGLPVNAAAAACEVTADQNAFLDLSEQHLERDASTSRKSLRRLPPARELRKKGVT